MHARLILFVALTFLSRPVSADYIFELRQDNGDLGIGAGGPGAFSVAEGGSTWMGIYLTQTATDTRLTANGVGNADLTMSIGGGVGVAPVAFVFGDGFVDDPFTPSLIDSANQSVRLSVFEATFLDGVRPNPNDFPASVHLASVQLLASLGSEGQYTLSVGTTSGAFGPLNDGTLFALAASPITNAFSVSAVPEPGIGLVLVAIGSFTLFRRRGR